VARSGSFPVSGRATRLCRYTQEWREDEPKYAVRHLERVPLGTSYVRVVEMVRSMMVREPLRGRTELVVDATGAGAPVVDLFREWLDVISTAGVMTPVTITAGSLGQETEGKGAGERRVPRQDLVAGLVVMLEEKKLAIAGGMAEARSLVEELVGFDRSSGTGAGSPGSGSHDDLVMALGLAVWAGTKRRELRMSRMPRPKSAKERAAELDFVATIFGVSGDRRTTW